ncbi:MAG TPA: UvrD-helicase domain-containing protein [Bacteroidales bacterium]|nr:UvrD-helicase domain-containing protein [Bacteroidales bacterium]
MNKILQELNEEQRAAVLHTEGATMVIAGAGSGKTRVLTYKVAWLISQGTDPYNILALTFTNKAAREMKERIIHLVGPDARNVWMGTFHATFTRLLRIEAHRIGYSSGFSIYDNDDSKSLLKSIVKELNLDPKVYLATNLLARISSLKTSLIQPADYLNSPELIKSDKIVYRPETGKIYEIYQNRLFKASAMDFDDLLVNTFIILRDFPDALYKYQQKFKYTLVDEYQDTNHVQYLIIKKIVANNENICVVGDDAQSIYAFRGANIANILNFTQDYPDHKLFKLEQNYRSTQTIVKAANSIIINNRDQIFKTIWTSNEQGHKIKILKASSDNEEGRLVSSSIFESKMNMQLPNSAFAILYRNNAQSRAIEEALRKLNIPYRIYGGLSFYKRQEIKDLLAYFRLSINPNDDEALLRIINYPARGIGKTTLEKLAVAASNKNMAMFELTCNAMELRNHFNSATANKLLEFGTMIRSFSLLIQKLDAYEAAQRIFQASGIESDLIMDTTPEGANRFENIGELMNAIKEFLKRDPEPSMETNEVKKRNLAEFMQDIALMTDADNDDKDGTDKVSLMTAHSAKGLEFPHVYITGMEENLFPSFQSLDNRGSLEEERRLFYVAVTRAKERLIISHAETRYRWGSLSFCEPSRFIEEIDPSAIEKPSRAKHSFPPAEVKPEKYRYTPKAKVIVPGVGAFRKLETPGEINANDNEYTQLQPGVRVQHNIYGVGQIVTREGTGPDSKATVVFDSVGQKQLLLRFAKLQLL